MKKGSNVALTALALVGLALGSAEAVVTMPAAADITTELAPVLTFGGLVIAGLLGFLGVRKGIKTVNRS